MGAHFAVQGRTAHTEENAQLYPIVSVVDVRRSVHGYVRSNWPILDDEMG